MNLYRVNDTTFIQCWEKIMIYGKVGSQYFRVLDSKDNSCVEDIFAIHDSIKYDFEDTLDENQWFYIEKFKAHSL